MNGEHTKTIHCTALQALAQRIFEAAGVEEDDAAVVAEMLVEADLMGLASHGVQRIPQYIEDMALGVIVPGAAVLVEGRSSTTALIDGQWNFGQIVARRAAEEAIAMASEHGTGSVVVRACRHIGRVGRYTEMCAAAGCIGLAMTAGGKEGHWVAPFGGREGRLGTNPIAFAAPTRGDPISMGFSTPIAPEGKVRLYRDTGTRFAEPALVDRQGRLSCDPSVLYAEDGSRAGAILPFGGEQGYKSFGLGLMVGILASAWGRPIWDCDDREGMTNGTWLLAIRIDAMMDTEGFRREIEAMAEYVCSSAASADSSGVRLPGQREFETMRRRRESGVPVDERIWQRIAEAAASVGVEVADSGIQPG